MLNDEKNNLFVLSDIHLKKKKSLCVRIDDREVVEFNTILGDKDLVEVSVHLSVCTR